MAWASGDAVARSPEAAFSVVERAIDVSREVAAASAVLLLPERRPRLAGEEADVSSAALTASEPAVATEGAAALGLAALVRLERDCGWEDASLGRAGACASTGAAASAVAGEGEEAGFAVFLAVEVFAVADFAAGAFAALPEAACVVRGAGDFFPSSEEAAEVSVAGAVVDFLVVRVVLGALVPAAASVDFLEARAGAAAFLGLGADVFLALVAAEVVVSCVGAEEGFCKSIESVI